MQKISVYLNKRASNSEGGSWIENINRTLFRSDIVYRMPTDMGELHTYLEADIRRKVDAIVSVGGDGTVNTLIQKLAGEKIGLLTIPAGTANDLAGELGNDKKLGKVLQTIRKDSYRFIDLININGKYMATNGGLGLGGEVASRVNELRRKYDVFKKVMGLSGKSIYSFFVVNELFGSHYKTNLLRIECDELSGEFRSPFLSINNQPTVAGTFRLAPGTANDDGKFNVSLCTHPNRRLLAQAMLKVVRGIHPKNDPYFHSFETRELKIKNLETSRPLQFFGDGEILHSETQEWSVSIEPEALKVYAGNCDKLIDSHSHEVTL